MGGGGGDNEACISVKLISKKTSNFGSGSRVFQVKYMNVGSSNSAIFENICFFSEKLRFFFSIPFVLKHHRGPRGTVTNIIYAMFNQLERVVNI